MKLLLISHNPISESNAMGKTLGSLLAAFSPEEICQLYIYPASPSQGRCGSFYQITDSQVLGWYLGRGNPGKQVEPGRVGEDAPEFSSGSEAALFRRRTEIRPILRLGRDWMWRFAPWYNGDLKTWMEAEKPDCILAAGGDALFLYDIAMKLSREYDLPVLGYFCDEYYFLKPEKRLIPRIRQVLCRRKLKEMMACSACFIAISREMCVKYENPFGIPGTVLMTGSELTGPVETREAGGNLVFMGNLAYGRYRTLAMLGKTLGRVNGKLGTQVSLDIYSAQEDPAAMTAFAEVPSICFHGFVSGKRREQVWRKAGLLVHVEDFSAENRDLVKHSISTKIPDILASGIPLLACGPAEVASMAYLMENDCAFLATKETELDSVLICSLQDGVQRERIAGNALEVARRNHDRLANSQKLRSCIAQVLENAEKRTIL